MERSLTVLLPVHNVQSTLAATIPAILEVVSELTARFELLIIDDGSTDATSEVAQELTCCYPQVRFLSHGSPLGCEAAIRTGLQQSSGEIIFVRHESAGAEVEELRKLWRAAVAHPVSNAPGPTPASSASSIRRSSSKSASPIPGRPDWQGKTPGDDDTALLSTQQQQELVWDGMPGRSRGARVSSPHAGHQPGYQVIHRPAAQQTHSRSRPARPNFLAKFKDLAWGE